MRYNHQHRIARADYAANVATADARLAPTRTYTTAEKIAHLDRSMARLLAAGLNWTVGYREMRAERDILESEAR